jgi:hypothetical protein
LLLNGQALLNLQLTSATMHHWVRQNVFASAVGTRAIRRKARRWLTEDLAAFEITRLACTNSLDSLQIRKSAAEAGLNLQGTHDLKHWNRTTVV